MTKKKQVIVEKEPMRETLRNMKPGMTLNLKLDAPRKIQSIRATMAYLNRLEPERGIKLTAIGYPEDSRIVVTAYKRER